MSITVITKNENETKNINNYEEGNDLEKNICENNYEEFNEKNMQESNYEEFNEKKMQKSNYEEHNITEKNIYKENINEKYINEMKLEIKSKSSNEAFARVVVAAFASQLDPNIEQIADIKTAVSEAITNSIIHAYENNEGIIKINAYLTKNAIEIEIIDFGKGIENVELARQTLYTSKPNSERSGMGFTIMESFMDELKVQSIVNIGTKIFMKKIIR